MANERIETYIKYDINKFGGLNITIAPELLQDEESRQQLNLRFEYVGKLTTRNGYIPGLFQYIGEVPAVDPQNPDLFAFCPAIVPHQYQAWQFDKHDKFISSYILNAGVVGIGEFKLENYWQEIDTDKLMVYAVRRNDFVVPSEYDEFFNELIQDGILDNKSGSSRVYVKDELNLAKRLKSIRNPLEYLFSPLTGKYKDLLIDPYFLFSGKKEFSWGLRSSFLMSQRIDNPARHRNRYAWAGLYTFDEAFEKDVVPLFAPNKWLGNFTWLLKSLYNSVFQKLDANINALDYWEDHWARQYLKINQYRNFLVISDPINGDTLIVDDYDFPSNYCEPYHRLRLIPNCLDEFDVNIVELDPRFGPDEENDKWVGVEWGLALYGYKLKKNLTKATIDQADYTLTEEDFLQMSYQSLDSEEAKKLGSQLRDFNVRDYIINRKSTTLLTFYGRPGEYLGREEVIGPNTKSMFCITLNNKIPRVFSNTNDVVEFNDLLDKLELDYDEIEETIGEQKVIKKEFGANVFVWQDYKIRYWPTMGVENQNVIYPYFLREVDKIFDKATTGTPKVFKSNPKIGKSKYSPLAVWYYKFVWDFGDGIYSAPSAPLPAPDIMWSPTKDEELTDKNGKYYRPYNQGGFPQMDRDVQTGEFIGPKDGDLSLCHYPIIFALDIRDYSGNVVITEDEWAQFYWCLYPNLMGKNLSSPCLLSTYWYETYGASRPHYGFHNPIMNDFTSETFLAPYNFNNLNYVNPNNGFTFVTRNVMYNAINSLDYYGFVGLQRLKIFKTLILNLQYGEIPFYLHSPGTGASMLIPLLSYKRFSGSFTNYGKLFFELKQKLFEGTNNKHADFVGYYNIDPNKSTSDKMYELLSTGWFICDLPVLITAFISDYDVELKGIAWQYVKLDAKWAGAEWGAPISEDAIVEQGPLVVPIFPDESIGRRRLSLCDSEGRLRWLILMPSKTKVGTSRKEGNVTYIEIHNLFNLRYIWTLPAILDRVPDNPHMFTLIREPKFDWMKMYINIYSPYDHNNLPYNLMSQPVFFYTSYNAADWSIPHRPFYLTENNLAFSLSDITPNYWLTDFTNTIIWKKFIDNKNIEMPNPAAFLENQKKYHTFVHFLFRPTPPVKILKREQENHRFISTNPNIPIEVKERLILKGLLELKLTDYNDVILPYYNRAFLHFPQLKGETDSWADIYQIEDPPPRKRLIYTLYPDKIETRQFLVQPYGRPIDQYYQASLLGQVAYFPYLFENLYNFYYFSDEYFDPYVILPFYVSSNQTHPIWHFTTRTIEFINSFMEDFYLSKIFVMRNNHWHLCAYIIQRPHFGLFYSESLDLTKRNLLTCYWIYGLEIDHEGGGKADSNLYYHFLNLVPSKYQPGYDRAVQFYYGKQYITPSGTFSIAAHPPVTPPINSEFYDQACITNTEIYIYGEGERLILPEQLSSIYPSSLLFKSPRLAIKIPAEKIPSRAKRLLIFRTKATHNNDFLPTQYGLAADIEIKRNNDGQPYTVEEFYDKDSDGNVVKKERIYDGFYFFDDVEDNDLNFATTPDEFEGLTRPLKSRFNVPLNERVYYYNFIEEYRPITPRENRSYKINHINDWDQIWRKYKEDILSSQAYEIENDFGLTHDYLQQHCSYLLPDVVYVKLRYAYCYADFKGIISEPKFLEIDITVTKDGKPKAIILALLPPLPNESIEMLRIYRSIESIADGTTGQIIPKSSIINGGKLLWIGKITNKEDGVFIDEFNYSLEDLEEIHCWDYVEMDYPTGLRWSEPYKPFFIKGESFTEYKGGRIGTGLETNYGNLVLFTEESCARYTVQALNPPISRVDELSPEVGCIAPNSMVNYNNTLYFLSWKGWMLYDNNIFKNIDSKINSEISKILLYFNTPDNLRLYNLRTNLLRDVTAGYNSMFNEIYLNFPMLPTLKDFGILNYLIYQVEPNGSNYFSYGNIQRFNHYEYIWGNIYIYHLLSDTFTKFSYPATVVISRPYYIRVNHIYYIDNGNWVIPPNPTALRIINYPLQNTRLYFLNSLGQLRSGDILPSIYPLTMANYGERQPDGEPQYFKTTQFLWAGLYIETPYFTEIGGQKDNPIQNQVFRAFQLPYLPTYVEYKYGLSTTQHQWKFEKFIDDDFVLLPPIVRMRSLFTHPFDLPYYYFQHYEFYYQGSFQSFPYFPFPIYIPVFWLYYSKFFTEDDETVVKRLRKVTGNLFARGNFLVRDVVLFEEDQDSNMEKIDLAAPNQNTFYYLPTENYFNVYTFTNYQGRGQNIFSFVPSVETPSSLTLNDWFLPFKLDDTDAKPIKHSIEIYGIKRAYLFELTFYWREIHKYLR